MKSNVRKVLVVAVAVVLALCFSTAVFAAKPVLSKKKMTINYSPVGRNIYSVELKNAPKKVTWYSENKKIAAVGPSGKSCDIYPKGGGTTVIVAKTEGKTYKCKVTIKTNPVLSDKKIEISNGEEYMITLTGTPSTPKWYVSDKKIVSIKEAKTSLHKNTMIITGEKNGTTTIIVEVDGKKLKCKVEVYGVGGNITIKGKKYKFDDKVANPYGYKLSRDGKPTKLDKYIGPDGNFIKKYIGRAKNYYNKDHALIKREIPIAGKGCFSIDSACVEKGGIIHAPYKSMMPRFDFQTISISLSDDDLIRINPDFLKITFSKEDVIHTRLMDVGQVPVLTTKIFAVCESDETTMTVSYCGIKNKYHIVTE